MTMWKSEDCLSPFLVVTKLKMNAAGSTVAPKPEYLARSILVMLVVLLSP